MHMARKTDVTTPLHPCSEVYNVAALLDRFAYAPSRTVVVYAPAEECDKDADLKRWGIPGLAVKGLRPYYAR
ncbi:hypothetical protein QJQ45_000574 [Haematococcus lacustris]|nr:hypothetical protein QJQ45_000574 [Haematococcus lacustris]